MAISSGPTSSPPETYRHHLQPRLVNRVTTELGPRFAQVKQDLRDAERLAGPYFHFDSEWPGHDRALPFERAILATFGVAESDITLIDKPAGGAAGGRDPDVLRAPRRLSAHRAGLADDRYAGGGAGRTDRDAAAVLLWPGTPGARCSL